MANKKIGFEFVKLAKMVKREVDKSVSIIRKIKPDTGEITGSNQLVMRFLYENQDRDIFQRDIEEYLSLRPSTVSANLKLMEKKGFITRQYMEYDTRLKKVVLTEKAMAIEEIMQGRIDKIEEKFARALTKEEQDMLLALIKKVSKEFE